MPAHIAASPPTPDPAPTMPAIAFDRFYRYAELTAIVQAVAAEHPGLVSIESIGKSHEGRDIWVLTVTNARHGPGRREACVLGGRQHPLDRGRRIGGRALFPADAGHAIRKGCGCDPRARHALVLRLSAVQPRWRRMGARRQAEVGPLEHAAVSVGRGRDRGADRRGCRRRRANSADAHSRFQWALEGPSRAAGAHGEARSDRNRRPLLPDPSRRHDGGLGRIHVARQEEQART